MATRRVTAYAFDQKTAGRVLDATRTVEQLKRPGSAPAGSRPATDQFARLKLTGGSLAAGGSQTATFYTYDGSTFTLGSDTVTVKDDLLSSGQTVAANAVIWCLYSYGRWWFAGTDCANIA